jgi:hypothetical protein
MNNHWSIHTNKREDTRLTKKLSRTNLSHSNKDIIKVILRLRHNRSKDFCYQANDG